MYTQLFLKYVFYFQKKCQFIKTELWIMNTSNNNYASSPATTPESSIDEEKFLVPYQISSKFKKKWFRLANTPFGILAVSFLQVGKDYIFLKMLKMSITKPLKKYTDFFMLFFFWLCKNHPKERLYKHLYYCRGNIQNVLILTNIFSE